MDFLLSPIVLTAAAVIWSFMTVLFFISLIIKRNDIADVAWGTGILIVGVVGYMLHEVPVDIGQGFGVVDLLFFLYVLWGVRLTYRIGRRNLRKSEEDPRYKRWRDSWGTWFYLRSYFQVYMLQGFLMIVVGSPLLIASTMLTVGPLVYVGLAIWVIGYFFEVVGDYQLDRFIGKKKRGETKKRIMDEGLWRYTRHPNYFGEVTMWWGVWLMVATLPMGWIALVSPLTITFLILKVSGVPLLEEQFAGDPEWEAYKQKTSVFIPWFPKKDII